MTTGTETTTGATPGGASEGGAWIPRHSGRESAAGLVWLPRLIDKGRRVLQREATGQDLLDADGYLFGVNDVADSGLLSFLGLSNDDVLDVLRREPDDAAAAAELVRRSGRSAQECAAWSERTLRSSGPFLAMMDADEGRRAPGAGTTLLRLAYNGLVMPPTYPLYRRAERRRREGQEGGAESGTAGRLAVTVLAAGGLVAIMGGAWWLLARRQTSPAS